MATAQEANKFMNDIMDQIDKSFNGPIMPGYPRNVGLVLVVFPMGADPSMANATITTNGVTKEVAAALLLRQGQLLSPPPAEAPKEPVN
jgi:hypothetical protein